MAHKDFSAGATAWDHLKLARQPRRRMRRPI